MVADLHKPESGFSKDARKVFGALCRAFMFKKTLTMEEYVLAGNVMIPDKKGKGGPFDIEARPYHRGICRAYHIWNYLDLVWAAQTGKSSFGNAWMSYAAAHDPAAMMIGFPDRASGARRSRNELIPTLEGSPGTMEELLADKDALSTFEYQLKRMVVMLAWAGSPASLASETIKHLWAEEAAKWIQRDKKEGDPISLFWRRGTDWEPLDKRLITTTPNFAHRHGWIEWLLGTQHEFYIPCPHCGDPGKLDHVRDPEDRYSADELEEDIRVAGYQVLKWRDGDDGKAGITGWGDEREPEAVEKLAGYRCVHCGEMFGDADKNRMLVHGKWIGRFPKRKWFSSRLPSWYSPQVSFGGVARRFYEAQGNPILLQDWTNSDAAEPFEETVGEKQTEDIRKHCCEYAPGEIPFRPLVIIITVDVQMSEMYYEIGAHGKDRKYAMIQSGRLPPVRHMEEGTFSAGLDLADTLMVREFRCLENDEVYTPTYGFMDSGDGEETDQIYRWAADHPGWMALKGQENQKDLVKFSQPEKELGADGRQRSRTDGALLVSVSSNLMKDGWALRWEFAPNDPGGWMLPAEVEDQYAFQLVQEFPKEVPVGKYGRMKRVWHRKSAQNHFFDCSYYQHAVSVAMEVDGMVFPEEEEAEPTAGLTSEDFKQGTSWVNGN